MIISIMGAWKAARASHLKYMQNIALGALKATGTRLSSSSFLLSLLADDIETLAVGSPSELRKVVENVRRAFSRPFPCGNYNEFLLECRRILNYERFRDDRDGAWNAYRLCAMAGNSMCPYCQLEETKTVIREGGVAGIRQELDHYYCQSKFPFLALSLYNLVPSCAHCNSALKRDKNFISLPHLHPFEDDEVIKIDIDIDSYMQIMHTPTAIAEFVLVGLDNGDPAMEKSIAASKRTFMLKERYQNEGDKLRNFLDRLLMVRCGDSELRLAISSKALDESVFMNFDCKDYKNARLGSAKRSLWELVPSE
ncbi:hypothetical protein [Stenotrophomonas chelatiphaga]|uniref:hypothetical protein n=1 Tax=Stenotrophomonas chelatiphaga TaxID=517011 RepID=UPI000A8A604B|nr:hypothetical protein [Stenotrophomonas chelatiphaga]